VVAAVRLAVAAPPTLFPIGGHPRTPRIGLAPQQLRDGGGELLIQAFSHLLLQHGLDRREGVRQQRTSVDFAAFWL
jgi:hypothetical protein